MIARGATSQAAEAPSRPVGARFCPWLWLLVPLAIALLVGGYGGYVLSKHHDGIHYLTGNAYIEYHEAGVEAGGTLYGFQGSVPAWIDALGSTHMDGWPSCLNRVGTHRRIRFGELPVTFPNGIGENLVVWVDCRG